MKKSIKTVIIFCLLILQMACNQSTQEVSLFDKFQNPASDARPMVRWWWNGNCVEADEIKRELAVLHDAGVGGVEINSIAMPPHAKNTNARPLQWAGEEWIKSVKLASDEARKLGMITDLIVGSGWPFGGRFLEDDQTIQRLGVKRQTINADSKIQINLDEYLTFNSQHAPGSKNENKASDVEILSVKLIPVTLKSMDEIIDISSEIKDNMLEYKTGNRDYELVFVYNERNFKSVYHGSPGADGPIMDHYKTDVVRAYLNRLMAIEKLTGVPLATIIRALFCDSIELGGSNWTDDMKELFMSKNSYDITPWLSFVVEPNGWSGEYEMSDEMEETIKRVQYDYYNTIIAVFLERFTKEFQDFCTENNVLCRYQAYGTPFYMGLFQGNMIPDIPESNNWIYSRGRDEAEPSEYTWVRNHGYMLWNKAASSAAHMTGKNITSCEAMTNTQGVFRTSLETIKQSDDMNFITGINHTVLHGYNYSPPEAGFPGWMRYGAYFSEHNTWWKYFKNWTDYNARLSSVFQNSKSTADIAILGRLRDYWGEVGPAREYLNDKPWYYAKLWQPISNLGSSCDYIHQPVLETATIDGDELICGEMRYKLVFLTEVESLTPAAARKLSAFALAGGKVVIIGTMPHRSLSFKDAVENDIQVKEAMEEMEGTGNALLIDPPVESEDFIAWTRQLMQKSGLKPQVKISNPQTNLYAMKQTAGNQDLYFFTNSDRKKNVTFDATFENNNKYPYFWDPQSGERFSLTFEEEGKLNINLGALESALIVFETTKLDLPEYEFGSTDSRTKVLNTEWTVNFNHVDGTTFTRKLEKLIDFSASEDEAIRSFSGTVTYSTTLDDADDVQFIHLSDVNQGVSELHVNGQTAGIKWYGNHIYNVKSLMQPGSNKIEITLTTTLVNYCMSLEDNATAEAWTRRYKQPFPSGLMGVKLAYGFE